MSPAINQLLEELVTTEAGVLVASEDNAETVLDRIEICYVWYINIKAISLRTANSHKVIFTWFAKPYRWIPTLYLSIEHRSYLHPFLDAYHFGCARTLRLSRLIVERSLIQGFAADFPLNNT